jgi:peptidoglycan/xylan/chitin deacetylase (PgdA/CDA1 family)
MRIPGLKTIIRTTRWLRSRLVPFAMILGYHRVADEPHDPLGLCVSREHFSEQLAIMQQYATLISLNDLIERKNKLALHEPLIALTFDDGYADLLTNALPILEAQGVPATVFIIPGHMGREFWWEEMDRIIFTPNYTPDHLHIYALEHIHTWKLRPGSNNASKRKMSRELGAILEATPDTERQSVLKQLRGWFGHKPGRERSISSLTATELQALAGHDLIAIGSHSVTHRALTSLSVHEQLEEIAQSKAILEELTGRSVVGFSYPHGAASRQSQKLLSDSGYHFACGSRNDVVLHTTEPYFLPRFWVGDWTGAGFESWLRRWVSRPAGT